MNSERTAQVSFLFHQKQINMQNILTKIQNLQKDALKNDISFSTDVFFNRYTSNLSIKCEVEYNSNISNFMDVRRFATTISGQDSEETRNKKLEMLATCLEQAIAFNDKMSDFNED